MAKRPSIAFIKLPPYFSLSALQNSLVMTGVADAEFEFSPDRIAIVPKGATPEQIDQAYSCNPQYLDEV